MRRWCRRRRRCRRGRCCVFVVCLASLNLSVLEPKVSHFVVLVFRIGSRVGLFRSVLLVCSCSFCWWVLCASSCCVPLVVVFVLVLALGLADFALVFLPQHNYKHWCVALAHAGPHGRC